MVVTLQLEVARRLMAKAGDPDYGGTLDALQKAGLPAKSVSDLTGFPFGDGAGYRYGLGVAPFTKVGSSVVFDPYYFTSPNYANLQSKAYNSGARISSNSWGANTPAYTSDSQAYDALVRDGCRRAPQ